MQRLVKGRDGRPCRSLEGTRSRSRGGEGGASLGRRHPEGGEQDEVRRLWSRSSRCLALVGAACSSDDNGGGGTTGTTGTTGGGGEITVGVSWNNYNEERWAKWDEPAIKAALDAGGAKYISTDAGSSAEQQLTDVENLISQGADALIILAQDGEAILPAVQSALDQGIPVVAYDRLIEDPGALYVTFDNVEVGRMQAEAVLAQVPKGNYVYIKGNSADANADFLRSGQQEVLQAAEDAGDIKNVGETYTDNWDPALAQTEMEQFLTREQQRRAGGRRRERRDGRRRRGCARGPGPGGPGGRVRTGRRRGGVEPRRARHADRGRVEGRAGARQGGRRGRGRARAGHGARGRRRRPSRSTPPAGTR